MELDLFKSFLAVAKARSFSEAARVLHTTQPTISRQITRLEAEIGVPLFERYGRHVECTVTGEFLLPLAQAIVTRTNEAVRLGRDQIGTASGTVRFGAVGNVMALLLMPILVSFLSAHPRVNVDMVEKDDGPLEEEVVSGELDCAVITPWGSTRTASQYLFSEEILLLVPLGHELAAHSAVPLHMLADELILLPRATMNAGNIVAYALRRAGLAPHFSYRATHPELSKAFVRKGFGVAPMPKMLLAPETLEGLVAIPFEEPLFRELRLISPRDRPLPVAARALIACVRAGFSDGGRADQEKSGRHGRQA